MSNFISKHFALALLAAFGCLTSLRAAPPKMQFRNGFEAPFELSGFPWRGANGELRRLPRKVKLPICFYGSSITQGCSAGHPGNNYTTMLCRAVGAPQINLGFSGAARGEVEVAEAIATLKMSALVIDYDHNAPDPGHLRKTHERFFRIVRKAQPELPIIFVSGPRDKSSPKNRERRDIVKATYDRAVAAGDEHVYFVDGLTFFDEVPRKYCTVDNTHPSDLGFYLMFDKILPVLRRALGE